MNVQTQVEHSGGGVERLNLREHAGMAIYVAVADLGRRGLGGGGGAGIFRRTTISGGFFYSYLAEFMFFLAIALGGLFFVLLQHATKAGWSVNVRRIAEWFASACR